MGGRCVGQVGAAAGGAELARGWMHKWRGKFPRRWEWRLFLLQQGAGLRYFRDSPGGHLELRGEVRTSRSPQPVSGFASNLPATCPTATELCCWWEGIA